MDGDLHILRLGGREAAVDGRGRGAPILVQLEPDGAGADLLEQPLGPGTVALAGKADVERDIVHSLEHARHVPRARRAGRRVGPGGGTGAAATPRGNAARQRLGRLLRTDEMDVRVDAAGGEDEALPGDRLGGDADHHARRDALHRVGIARLADALDAALLDPQVGLVDAGVVDDERVGDHAVQRLGVAGAGLLALAVAQHLAAAELALVAIAGEVALHLGEERRVAQAHAVAGGRAVEVGVVAAVDALAHRGSSNAPPFRAPPVAGKAGSSSNAPPVAGSSAWPKPRADTAARRRARFSSLIGPSASALPPRTTAAPAKSTSATVFFSPGSKRTAVPAGMSSRLP